MRFLSLGTLIALAALAACSRKTDDAPNAAPASASSTAVAPSVAAPAASDDEWVAMIKCCTAMMDLAKENPDAKHMLARTACMTASEDVHAKRKTLADAKKVVAAASPFPLPNACK